MAHSGVHAPDLVGYHCHAKACAADEDAPLKGAVLDLEGQVVPAFRALSPRMGTKVVKVCDLDPFLFKMRGNDLLKVQCGVITVYYYSHILYFYCVFFLVNSEGSFPNCFWKLEVKYEGEEKPTR